MIFDGASSAFAREDIYDISIQRRHVTELVVVPAHGIAKPGTPSRARKRQNIKVPIGCAASYYSLDECRHRRQFVRLAKAI